MRGGWRRRRGKEERDLEPLDELGAFGAALRDLDGALLQLSEEGMLEGHEAEVRGLRRVAAEQRVELHEASTQGRDGLEGGLGLLLGPLLRGRPDGRQGRRDFLETP